MKSDYTLMFESYMGRKHPSILLENYYNDFTRKEQKQIEESFNVFYKIFSESIERNNIILTEGLFSSNSNKSDDDKKQAIEKIVGNFRKNINTYAAQFKNDVSKVGIKDNDPAVQELNKIINSIANSKADIKFVDSSLGAKVGAAGDKLKGLAKDKVIPVIAKVVAPVIKKIEQLYENSGPIKNFDVKYNEIINKLGEKYPSMAEPIKKFSEMAKKNKGKATLIIGALTALLAASGAAGPAAPVLMGVGLRGLYGLMAGEPPAKSFGKAAITATVGKIIGAGFGQLFADVDASGMDSDLQAGGVNIAAEQGLPDDVLSMIPDNIVDEINQIVKIENALERFKYFEGSIISAEDAYTLTSDTVTVDGVVEVSGSETMVSNVTVKIELDNGKFITLAQLDQSASTINGEFNVEETMSGLEADLGNKTIELLQGSGMSDQEIGKVLNAIYDEKLMKSDLDMGVGLKSGDEQAREAFAKALNDKIKNASAVATAAATFKASEIIGNAVEKGNTKLEGKPIKISAKGTKVKFSK